MTSPSYDWVAHHAVVRGDKVAAHDLASGRKFTYSEMNDRNSRLASALREEFGIERGDRVAVLAENDTNFFEVQFACWKLGAIFVPLNWRLSIPELEYIIGDANPDVIIHDDPFADNAIKLAELCEIDHRITWGPSIGSAAAYEEVLASHPPLANSVNCTHDDAHLGYHRPSERRHHYPWDDVLECGEQRRVLHLR